MQSSKKKSKPKNAFFHYTLEYRTKQAKKGIIYDSIAHATNAASPSWQKLSREQKIPYELQAKKDKQQGSSNRDITKYTSQGVSLQEMERINLQIQNDEKEMLSTIKEILQQAQENGSLDRTKFYFICCESFCQTLSGDIYPAEIGVAKFSLREGIYASLHMFVNPGVLPLGYAAVSQETADKTHQLPLPPNAMGLSSYVDILSQIVNFVADESCPEDLPIFFCNEKEIKDTKMVVKKISEEAGELNLNIKIYPIKYLFFLLKEITVKMSNKQNGLNDKPFISIVLAADMINRDNYMYSKNVGCKFHDNIDCSTACALSKAKRWGFRIADFCTKDLRIEFIPGQHAPDECDFSEASTLPIMLEDAEVDNDTTISSMQCSDSESSYRNFDKFSGKFSTSSMFSDFNLKNAHDSRRSGTNRCYRDFPELIGSENGMSRRGTFNNDPAEPASSDFSFSKVVATGRGYAASMNSSTSSTAKSVGRGYYMPG